METSSIASVSHEPIGLEGRNTGLAGTFLTNRGDSDEKKSVFHVLRVDYMRFISA
jgi:hypothetical protein